MNHSTSFRKMINELENDGDTIASFLCRSHYVTTEFCDYLTCRNDMISYLPAGREHKLTDDGRWARDGRQEMKPAKLARKVLKLDDIIANGYRALTDADFEKFANNVKAYLMENGDDEGNLAKLTLKVVNGECIQHYYDQNNYNPKDTGSNLAGSCMKDRSASYFDIYANNPEVCSMLVCVDADNLVHGRAILWNDINHKKLMDTIYAPDNIRPLFINFAIKNGMQYKMQQSCHHESFDMFNGNTCNPQDTSVQLSSWTPINYPYMDTLQYLDINTGILSNDAPSTEYYELRSTRGSYETHNSEPTVMDDLTGDEIAEDNAVYLDYVTDGGDRFCGYTHTDNVTCTMDGDRLDSHCLEVSGRYYETGSSSLVYSEYECDYILYNDAVYIESDNDYIRQCDAVEHAETGDYMNEADAVEIDGNYYHANECMKDDEGNYILIGSTSETELN